MCALSASNGSDCWEHHVSYLLDGFQCGDCGERCGRHFPNVHIHITAVFADSQRGIFFRNVFGLFDIFRALFDLRFAVHDCVCHCIQVISVLLLERRRAEEGGGSRFLVELKLTALASSVAFLLSWLKLRGFKKKMTEPTSERRKANKVGHLTRYYVIFTLIYFFFWKSLTQPLASVLQVCCHPQTATSPRWGREGAVCWGCQTNQWAVCRRW